jgi:hypothetical protein
MLTDSIAFVYRYLESLLQKTDVLLIHFNFFEFYQYHPFADRLFIQNQTIENNYIHLINF